MINNIKNTHSWHSHAFVYYLLGGVDGFTEDALPVPLHVVEISPLLQKHNEQEL